MAEMSNYLENALINGTLRNTQYTVPTTVYLALHVADPTDAGTGAEVAQGNYARQAIAFAAPADGVSLNSADVTYPVATVNYASAVTHFGIWDAATVGNLLYHSPVDNARTILVGDQLIVSAGQISVTLA